MKFIWQCQAGTGQAPARQAAIAGLPNTVVVQQ
jgi:hypothetical protein